MVKIGNKSNYHRTWYQITNIAGNMVTTVEDPELNLNPNVCDFTFWGLHQVGGID